MAEARTTIDLFGGQRMKLHGQAVRLKAKGTFMSTASKITTRGDVIISRSFPVAAIGVGLASSLIWTTFLGYVLLSLVELLV